MSSSKITVFSHDGKSNPTIVYHPNTIPREEYKAYVKVFKQLSKKRFRVNNSTFTVVPPIPELYNIVFAHLLVNIPEDIARLIVSFLYDPEVKYNVFGYIEDTRYIGYVVPPDLYRHPTLSDVLRYETKFISGNSRYYRDVIMGFPEIVSGANLFVRGEDVVYYIFFRNEMYRDWFLKQVRLMRLHRMWRVKGVN